MAQPGPSSSSGSSSTLQPSQSGQPSSTLVPEDPAHVNQQFGGQYNSAYDDPSALLRVIPLANYAPTARVIQHMAPHTQVYPSPYSPNLYPQYAQAFQSMNKPASQQDWAMRQAAEARLAHLLQTSGPGYAQGYPSPASMPAYNSSSFERPSGSQSALPYSFLPSHTTSPSPRHPPTPTSMSNTTPSPSGNTDPRSSFEQMVDDAVKRNQSPSLPAQNGVQAAGIKESRRSREGSSAPASTPTIARGVNNIALDTAFEDSPDPLALSRPSPTKRRRSNYQDPEPSPTLNTTTLPTVKQTRMPFSSDKATPSSLPLKVNKTIPSRTAIPAHGQQQSPVKVNPRLSVEISLSPASARRRQEEKARTRGEAEDEDEEESLDWGDEADGDGDWVMGKGSHNSPSPGGGAGTGISRSARTGERDTRSELHDALERMRNCSLLHSAAQQKFSTLLEDIFEASDALPADPDAHAISQSKVFDSLAKDGSTPLLSVENIDKIARYVTRLNKTKRYRVSAGTQEGAVTWDEEALKRLFRLLERCMRDAENPDPFPFDGKGNVRNKKAAKAKGGKKTKSPDLQQDGSQDVDTLETEGHGESLTEEEIERCEAVLGAVQRGAAAVECCLAILDSEGLSKPMYSEDILTLCTALVRDQMTKVIFPVVEGTAGEKINSRFLSHIVELEITVRKTKQKLNTSFAHPVLSSIAQSSSAALPRLSALISRAEMSFSDSLVIQSVYLAIAPLFVTEPVSRRGQKEKGTGTKGEYGVMKALRIEALGCLRGAFAKYVDQRQWILEEVLSSLIKLPSQKTQAKFQSASGSSMSTISALLLQLIQAAAHGVIPQIRKLRLTAVETELGGKAGAKNEAIKEEQRLCQDAVESVYRSARVIAAYLIQKSTSTKVSKTTTDTDYKVILDRLVDDLLNNLYLPEWPAAAIFLNVFSRLVISALEDQASSAEGTAVKNIALDHLGNIAAKLKGVHLTTTGEAGIKSLDQIVGLFTPSALTTLFDTHNTVHSFLSASAREDGMYSSAGDLQIILWAQDIQAAQEKTDSLGTKLEAEKDEEAIASRENLLQLSGELRAASSKIWAQEEDVFGASQADQRDGVTAAALDIGSHHPLQSAFDPILHALIGSLNLSAVALRSKALKGLSTIIQVDPNILSQTNVREAFEERLSDTSPAVRDAAVDLIGKFIVQKPELAAEYYPHITLRVSDSGLGVRKKVVKLLKEIYEKSSSDPMRVEICCKMLEMVGDEDDNIKEMATKSVAEMIYSENDKQHESTMDSASLLVGIIGHFRGSARQLDEALLEITKLDELAGKLQRSETMVDALIQRLIDATEQSDFDSISHVKAISLMTASKPDLIDPKKAGVLLHYLRPATSNTDEQASNELLLRIFRLSIPSMPKTASTFSADLTVTLFPMIGKPGRLSSVVELIGCLCAAVKYLTKDYRKLLLVVRRCESMLQASRQQYQKTGSIADTQKVGMTMYITALVAEFCNLDEVATEDHAVQQELRGVSGGEPMFQHLYDLFLDFTRMNIPQFAPTSSLGCLFRSYPSLVLRDETDAWMKSVYASNDFDNKARLFGVIHDFLESEAKRKATGGAYSQDMQALIGNASELSESGVSTAIVQRNIQHILDGAKSHHPSTQAAAMDVLAFTVNQGLYHPLQCLPILISLETHQDLLVSERALELHTTLHRKHSALVNVRFIDFARASYEYQRSISSEVAGHRDGSALLAGWFALVGEKRAWRLDFLRALGKAFDYDTSQSTPFNVGFLLYISENLAAFEYKQQEEVMIVIQQLSAVISTCTPLVTTVENAKVDGEPEANLENRMAIIGASSQEAAEAVPAESLINSTLIVSLALLTKNHLLDLYTLTEDKCLKQATVKKSTLGEKPAVRKGSHILTLERIPLIRGVYTVRDFHEQQATEDGVMDIDN